MVKRLRFDSGWRRRRLSVACLVCVGVLDRVIAYLRSRCRGRNCGGLPCLQRLRWEQVLLGLARVGLFEQSLTV